MSDSERRPGTADDPSAEHGDAIARLLALAGPRPPVPDEATARVKAAVHAHWRQRIDVRPHPRRVLPAALAAAAMVLLGVGTWLWLASSNRTPPGGPSSTVPVSIARVVTVMGEGSTMVLPGAGQPVGLATGGAVGSGATIATSASARVALRTPDGISLRLDRQSRVRLLSASELVLEGGAVYVDNPSAAAGRARIEVRTPLGSASDVGTQFETRMDTRGLRVRVREGTVVVRGSGATESARAGEELRMDAAGTVQRRRLPAYDPEWAWVVEIAPAPAIEGRPLGEFLEWAAREGGWRVEYAGAELARSAPGILLHGSVEGLTPASALAAVLPTCGLVHRVRDGALVIEELSGKKPDA